MTMNGYTTIHEQSMLHRHAAMAETLIQHMMLYVSVTLKGASVRKGDPSWLAGWLAVSSVGDHAALYRAQHD